MFAGCVIKRNGLFTTPAAPGALHLQCQMFQFSNAVLEHALFDIVWAKNGFPPSFQLPESSENKKLPQAFWSWQLILEANHGQVLMCIKMTVDGVDLGNLLGVFSIELINSKTEK